MYICIYVYMYICIYVYMYICIYVVTMTLGWIKLPWDMIWGMNKAVNIHKQGYEQGLHHWGTVKWLIGARFQGNGAGNQEDQQLFSPFAKAKVKCVQ